MVQTDRQKLGDIGEKSVVHLPCPRCKRQKTLRQLPVNFKCADVICDFCGFLAQVKSSKQPDINVLPATLMGAAWGPQAERMQSGIFFPLFIVLVSPDSKKRAIYYLPSDLQQPEMFQKRNPLGPNARRAGWTGYTIRLDLPGTHAPVRLL
jgi:hypothetical protein